MERTDVAGRIVSVNVSETKGVRKTPVSAAEIIARHGIAHDAHAGNGHRQISLLARESIDRMIEMGLAVGPGDFAENLTTVGIDLPSLPIGQRMRLGSDVLVEVTQIGKVCHNRCAIYEQAGDCVMPREGIFVRVLHEGRLKPGDEICLVESDTSAIPSAPGP